MKGKFALLYLVLIVAVILSSCATPAPATVAPVATEAPQVVEPAVTEAPVATEVVSPTEEPPAATEAASPTEPPAAAGPMSLKVALTTEPISMDPHVGNDSNTSTALLLAFDGLLNVKNGAIEPGIAESYEVSEDGTVYTFHLRDAKWADGKPVTATDYAETWKRMLTRKDAMDLAYLILPIKNAQPVNAGEKDVSDLGIKVIDAKTLEVTLEAAFPFMVSLFASSPMYPIRMDLVEQYGDAYGSDADKIVSNGPFLLKEWAHNDRMVFVKNPDYWDADSIKIEEVTLLLVTDPNTLKNMYDTGEIYWMEVPSDSHLLQILAGSDLTANRTLTLTTGDANRTLTLPVVGTVGIVIDGGGSAITTGIKGYVECPYAGTIVQATMLADQSGSIVVDVWKDTYANYPPTDADSITAAAPPTISTARKSQDSTLTGWTTSVTAGDIFGFNVDSASTVTRVTLILKINRS